MALISFALPLAGLLLFLPLLVQLLPPRSSGSSSLELPEGLSREGRAPARLNPLRGRGGLALLIWALLVLALAQPQRVELRPDRSATGRDILLVLDMSGSMATEDFSLDGETVSRLTAVRRVAGEFIRARQGDRVGLIVFADRAYVSSPLSHDLNAVVRALDEAVIGLTGRSTAISDGLGLALKRSLASDAQSRVIVLFSDGRDTAARIDAREVARLSAGHGIRIHSVALGPEDLETRPTSRDAVDIATLREIAEIAGGETFRVRTLEDLQAMAETLDALEPNPALRPPVAVYQGLWPWPAGLALLLLGVLIWRRPT
ncbi:VWA domain-containing protein [Falsigemmobacter intermedius]|uniref:VWA domain-containing protein n=1 Tax=Falsigemmobacter intermedius TaxID=1553448 RepID=UPI003F09E3ED